MTAGGVLGPLAGGTLAHWFGMRMTFFLGAAFLFMITIILMIYIKDPAKKAAPKASTDKSKKRGSLLKNPVVRRMLLAAGVAQLSILLVQPIMPMYIEELSGHEGDIVLVTGIVFSVVGLSGVIAAPRLGDFL